MCIRDSFECDIPEVAQWQYGYDPRVCKLEDKYVVTWCNAYGCLSRFCLSAEVPLEKAADTGG